MEKNNKELQNTELDILKQFIKVCDKLNLNYYMVGGSLIGVIRHKGFIPWDDDIDVGMHRDDYEKFIKEGQKYLDKNYFIQTYQTDPNYPNCFAKLRNSETTFIESSVNYIDMNHGIYIDIFPFDNYYQFNRVKNKLIQYAKFYNYYKKSDNLIKRLFALIAKTIYFNKTTQELCIMQDKMYKRKNKNNTKYIINYSGAWGIKRERQFSDILEEYEIRSFEGIKVKIPKQYDIMLRNTYGDYMQLPPEENRVAHHYSDVIDTNKSYKEYLNK